MKCIFMLIGFIFIFVVCIVCILVKVFFIELVFDEVGVCVVLEIYVMNIGVGDIDVVFGFYCDGEIVWYEDGCFVYLSCEQIWQGFEGVV